MLPRDVLTIFPPDDRVALFVASICMASNDVEDGLVEVESFDPGEAEDPDTFHRRRFSYRVRMLNGHLYEGTVALKAWRRAESGVRRLLNALDQDGRKVLALVCSLEQRIGPEALRAVRQNSFHYPHPDPKRNPDSTVYLADAIRKNPELEAGIDVGEDARGTFRFADQLSLSVAFGGHHSEHPGEQVEWTRRAAHAFVFLAKEVYLAYCRERGVGFEYEDGEPL